jgi:hypothetical protein
VLCIGVVLLHPLYTLNPRLGWVLETTSAGLAAHSLVREADLDTREYFPGSAPGRYAGYALLWRGDALYSIEPLASILTFAPFLLPHRDAWPVAAFPQRIFNAAAAHVAMLTLIAMGVWLLSVTSPRRALASTFVIALGTSHWTTSAAGPWQHTSGALWLVAGLFAWWHAPGRASLYAVAALATALAAACRPILLPVSLLVLVDSWLVTRAPRRVALASTALVVAIGCLALYTNWYFHGFLLGGRMTLVTDPQRFHAVDSYFSFSLRHLAGLLISPNRGLFVYSPVLLLAIPGLLRCLRRDASPPSRLISIAGLAVFALYGGVSTWWAGAVYGTRYMTDLLPFFALWLARTPLPRRGRTTFAALLAVSCVASVWVQHLGATRFPCSWNKSPVHVDRAPERVWSWSDTQIARCAGW